MAAVSIGDSGNMAAGVVAEGPPVARTGDADQMSAGVVAVLGAAGGRNHGGDSTGCVLVGGCAPVGRDRGCHLAVSHRELDGASGAVCLQTDRRSGACGGHATTRCYAETGQLTAGEP